MTNVLVGGVLGAGGGGSQIVGALTGMSIYATCFLIRCVIAGGLRSTFIADYTLTVILFIAIFVFGFVAYTSGGPIGRYVCSRSLGVSFRAWADADSPLEFYDLLVDASEKMLIAGNYNGS